MSDRESFRIDLKGLSEGCTAFDYDLDADYFASIQAPVVHSGKLQSHLTIRRIGDVFELDFHTEGVVSVPCNLCLDDMEQPIITDDHLMAKFGENNSEDDDLITVQENVGILDVEWLIYEFIELNIPLRHVHAPGQCNPVMTKLLKEHSGSESGHHERGSTDSRWAALLKLKEKE